ncbi:NRDE family protein [Rhodohalobacter sp. 8-1]|uniref:NRDE family protein n=1 Tax=Rhodohalobacter sp. 8-1 TaxID=3131972 RepID=UPI0030EDB81E
MCLIVFSYNHHKKYPVILAGNRDEFYGRDARQAHFWDTSPPLLAGKDLRAGGTWLGVNQNGEFGAITNFRDLDNPINGERSRGEIIPEFLTQPGPPKKKLSRIQKNSSAYSGFNLLAGNANQIFYLNNVNRQFQSVKPGIHGISNAFLDTPWPKVEKAKSLFKKVVQSEKINPEEIFQLLQDSESFPLEKLPNTGLSPEMEKAVSPIFIETDDYGTRCSSLLTIDNDGQVQFTERTFHVTGDGSETVKEYSFNTAHLPPG